MANALEAASLVMIPSGYEDGTLGSLKPTDGTGDFTFSRGSDISATRVNEDGYIEKGYENLLLQSNTFSDVAWAKIGVTATGGQEGYDGTSDAWLLEKDANGFRRVYQSITLSGVKTFSVYLKAGTLSRADILLFRPSLGAIQFNIDLSTGTKIGSSNEYIDTKITDVGNGWYRCDGITNETISAVSVYIDLGTSTAGSIYIQDAMLNQGMVSYPYVETTTAPVAGGILEDMPRLDYTDSSCPALLLEPQRTNLIDNSEYFGSWTNDTNTNQIPNAINSPEGFQNATKLVAGTSVARQGININSSTGGDIIFSVYAKKAGYDVIQLTDGVSANRWANFDLENGEIGSYQDCTPSIEPLGNEWYRCIVSYNSVSMNRLRISIQESPTQGRLVQFAGNGTNGIYIYGAAHEQATYPTSYIPTYGTSQTRLRDSATASVTNTTSRTYFLDGKRLADEGVDNTSPVYSPNDNLKITFWTNNRLRFRFGGQINRYYTLVGDDFKIAISYDGTDSKIFVNGVYWMTLSSFNLGNVSALTTNGNEGVSYNQLLLFPTALSDDECIELTTI